MDGIRRLERRQHDRPEDVVKQLHAPHRGSAQRVAVIRIIQAQISGLLGGGLALREQAVLEGDFQRRFDGGGAVVREEDVVEALGCDLHERLRQLRHGGMRGAEQRGVRKTAELFRDGGVDFWNAVAEQIAPQRRRPVEQPPAAIVDEVVTLRSHHHQRLGGEILLHLRERVPHMRRVPLAEKKGVGCLFRMCLFHFRPASKKAPDPFFANATAAAKRSRSSSAMG